MDLNARHYQVNQQKVHSSNFNLYRSRKMVGMIGSKHSQLITKLSKKLQEEQEKENEGPRLLFQSQLSPKDLLHRITELEREESNLKKEMLRISELSKINKNSKIAIQIKYQSLLQQYSRSQNLVSQLTEKVSVLNELNGCLFKITDKFLQVFPSYQSNCEGLIQLINVVKTELETQNKANESKGDSNVVSSLSELQNRLDSFKGTVDNMQSFQKKLLSNLAEAQMDTKTISQRVSIMSHLNKDELFSFKKQLSDISELILPQPEDQTLQHQKQLGIHSEICSFTFFPDFSSRLSKTFKQISMVFEHHIHMLETQKMEYQFTKNKKLIACQKFDCQICQSYQKIVSQIFSIVRQAFKEIKFQFMKQTKEISDSSEIPFLI